MGKYVLTLLYYEVLPPIHKKSRPFCTKSVQTLYYVSDFFFYRGKYCKDEYNRIEFVRYYLELVNASLRGGCYTWLLHRWSEAVCSPIERTQVNPTRCGGSQLSRWRCGSALAQGQCPDWRELRVRSWCPNRQEPRSLVQGQGRHRGRYWEAHGQGHGRASWMAFSIR
jgi:hypothetical protein